MRGATACFMLIPLCFPPTAALRRRRDVVRILMPYQHIMPIVFVVDSKPIYKGSTGFVEAVYFYVRAQLPELEYNFI
jgi:hypothetical protein